MLFFYLHAFFPMKKQISSRQKTCDSMSSEVMYPSFIFQLDHYGINEWVTSSSLKIDIRKQ